MLYSRFCIKKMGIPFTLIILQQLDTIVVHVVVEDNQEKFKIVGKVTKSTFTKLFVELVEI
ncbi:MAG: hypothetical protein WBK73_08540 [Tepidanaerobacteraceae bacterium]